ncbi:hypothetical protein EDD33_1880 [Nocardioides aurantiacus]|uniref:Uncharacterized protein n=1 Tax=Nocardioides aurantiacus TaxID=86796 RepID=A0A3N2CU10_9ACTN|nr:hypothetical protein EDD33_1880 [Nocardioides aurantiacus]
MPQKQTARGSTWGEYTVVGTYSEGVFTLTRPPVPLGPQVLEEEEEEVPWTASSVPKPSGYDIAELHRIARTVVELPGALLAGPEDGYVELLVVYDDGTLQRELDERYPGGAVRVFSVLQPYQPT